MNYDEVLRELIAAVGAALFIGNLVALIRRRRAERAPKSARPRASTGPGTDLTEAPVARTVLYMVLGLVIAVWGIGSIIVS